MGLEDFKKAYEAMPEKSNGEDVLDFVAGVVVSYLPIEAAIKALLMAAAKVAEYGEEVAAQADEGPPASECHCPTCVAKREAEKPKH